MIRKLVACLLVVSLAAALPATAIAKTKEEKQAEALAKIRSKVLKISESEKRLATVKLKDGRRIRGYLSKATESNFVITEEGTGTVSTIVFTDVASVEKHTGHSTARNITIGVLIGIGALLGTLFAIFMSIDD